MTALDDILDLITYDTPICADKARAELAAYRKVAEAVQRMREKLDEHGFLRIVLAITELDAITKG